MRRIGALAAMCLLSACANAPAMRYYTLDMTPASVMPPSVNIHIDRLQSSEALHRRELLIKKSGTQVEYYAQDQWAAGVEELVWEKFEAEFGDFDPARPTIHVSGIIRAFEQVDVANGAEGHIKIELGFRTADLSRYDPPLLERVYDVHVPAASASPDDVVRALTKGLETIASRVVTDANGLGEK